MKLSLMLTLSLIIGVTLGGALAYYKFNSELEELHCIENSIAAKSYLTVLAHGDLEESGYLLEQYLEMTKIVIDACPSQEPEHPVSVTRSELEQYEFRYDAP